MKILVIDDEKWLRQNIVTLLELEGHEVISAENGLTGVRLAREALPDMIICDIMMPDIDGYAVLEELSHQLSTSIIPFIFLTAKSDRLDYRQGMILGADDYIVKPVSDVELLAAINSRVQKRNRIDLDHYQKLAAHLVSLQEQHQRSFVDFLLHDFYEELKDLQLILQLGKELPKENIDLLLNRVFHTIDNLSKKSMNKIQDLNPYLINNIGLIASLQWYLQKLDYQTTFQCNLATQRLPAPMEHAIFRVVQQVTFLVQSHFKFTIWQDNQHLHAHLEFDIEGNLLDQTTILLMQEYIRQASGSFDIQFDTSVNIHIKFVDIPSEDNIVIEDVVRNNIKSEASITNLTYVVATDDTMLGSLIEEFLYLNVDCKDVRIIEQNRLPLELVQHIQPDIVILDHIDSIELVSKHFRTIFLSSYDSPAYIHQLFKKHVDAVILKDDVLNDMVDAVKSVYEGEFYVSSSVQFSLEKLDIVSSKVVDPKQLLTRREYEVLELILKDNTHTQIGDHLSISHRTVEKHRANLMQKLGMRTHTELILFAVKHGLIED